MKTTLLPYKWEEECISSCHQIDFTTYHGFVPEWGEGDGGPRIHNYYKKWDENLFNTYEDKKTCTVITLKKYFSQQNS